MVSFTPLLLYPWRKRLKCWVGPRPSLGAAVKRRKSHPCPYQEMNPSLPAYSLAIPALSEPQWGTDFNINTQTGLRHQFDCT
jgi:hypothetical protein